ncbi:FecR family protein [Sphingobacterium spiritivorum]|uniref:FecR family protein n=1 Tax=Sphingobacterium spiritivorum TaxID=258 RepID=UPI003DA364E5
MNDNTIDILVEKYASNTCSEQERMLLELWIETLPETDKVILSAEQKQFLWEQLDTKISSSNNTNSIYRRLKRYLPYVAALLIMSMATLFVWQIRTGQQETQVNIADKVVPGSDQATLTLADGRKIELTTDHSTLASGITIRKTAEGQLKYVVQKGIKGTGEYNTIETPRGGQFLIELSDGSEVTLNAASSLRFPIDMTEGELRKVELKGEGYFAVAKDKKRPFIVQSNQQEIKVLGTVFNVNTYDQSNSITTLLEGKIQINNQKILTPGQQAQVKGQDIVISQVDVEDFVDWKNNEFVFRDESLQSIMNRVSRWYNVDVQYAKEGSRYITFSGKISRYAEVEKVLELLQSTSTLKFRIINRTIIVNQN